MKHLNEFLLEAENQARKQRYQKIAKILDKAILNKKFDSRTSREIQRLNDLCVLAAHHIDDANEFAIQAKAFPGDAAAQKEAIDLRNEADKICLLADKKIARMAPSLASQNVHLT